MLHSIAPTFAGVLKYAPDQQRGSKGTPQGGRFVTMDWGDEPSLRPSEPRRVEVDLARMEMLNYAKASAGPVLLGELGEANRFPFYHQQEVRAAVKRSIATDLTARLVKHPAFAGQSSDAVARYVQGQLDLWAETSGDHNGPAIRMQYAVKDEFGLTDASMNHLDVAITAHADFDARARAFARAEYERTQAFFKVNGITHLSLFRGMANDEAGLELGVTEATMQPASSWSTDLHTAITFAVDQEADPVVLTTRVPVTQVLSTAVTGRGALPEEEVILLGQSQSVRVYGLGDKEDPAFAEHVEGVERKIKASLR